MASEYPEMLDTLFAIKTKFVTDVIVENFMKRDNALVERPFYTKFSEVTTAATVLTQVLSRKVPVPESSQKLVMVFLAKVDNGPTRTSTYEWRIGGLTSSSTTAITTSYVEKTCTFSNVTTVQDSEVTMELWAKIDASPGGELAYAIEVEGPACHFKSAA